ncbi:MAG: SusD/RagB family nutrient-binding outer membrane lipoprotein, partial [Ferruginibacter sp.]|nr:SusD/RagB family nutrient-binding outer membrane lipoprotein [Ferruginibacter sp.]
VTYTVPFSFTAYLNQPAVLLSGTSATALNQILTQKYLAYARNSGLQGYYQWRRTGVPTFSTGDGTGNGGTIPKRFQYPNNEQTVNASNVKAAIQSQYGGAGDDINQLMWLIK